VGRILEHDAKEHLARHGIAVPAGRAATTSAVAADAAAELGGRVVVKALVPANRRAKAGAVRFADDAAAAAGEAERLLGATVAGHQVGAVLVEDWLDVEGELFFSVVVDRDRQQPVALASASGGIDVEEASDELRSAALDPGRPPLPHRLRELWASAGVSGPDLVAATALAHRAAACFFASDATILEVNPLALVRDADGAPLSRSGGLTAEVGLQLRLRGLGVSTAVGIGGEAMIGTSPAELLRRFRADPGTDAVVYVGEPGTRLEEELAAELAEDPAATPLVAVVLGGFVDEFPPGTVFGHAAAVVERGRGSARDKARALADAGALVAESFDNVFGLVEDAIGMEVRR
jgi:ATP-grasp domain-containing protein/CoA ligase-like protein